MKQIRIHEHGSADALQLDDVPEPQPAAGEVVVTIAAAGINFIDVYQRRGYYPLPQLPSGLGLEAAGTVSAVGAGVSEFSVGQRVAYVGRVPGAYAEQQAVPASILVRLPDSIAFDTAAAVMLKGMTARYLVKQTYRLGAGDVALVHAAAGGVGLLLCAWARHLGATVVGTVGSEAKAQLAREAGCHHVINYREADVAAQVKELVGECSVVYDSVGAPTFEASLAVLRRRGMLVTFGQAGGAVSAFDPVQLSRHGSLFLTRPTLFDYIAEPTERAENAADLFAAIDSGVLAVRIGQRFPLAETAAAHRALEARQTTGSTVLEP